MGESLSEYEKKRNECVQRNYNMLVLLGLEDPTKRMKMELDGVDGSGACIRRVNVPRTVSTRLSGGECVPGGTDSFLQKVDRGSKKKKTAKRSAKPRVHVAPTPAADKAPCELRPPALLERPPSECTGLWVTGSAGSVDAALLHPMPGLAGPSGEPATPRKYYVRGVHAKCPGCDRLYVLDRYQNIRQHRCPAIP